MAIKVNYSLPDFPPFRMTREEMRRITTAVMQAEQERFRAGLKPDLSPAAPLSRGYAIGKSKRTGKRAVRDWAFKRDLPASLRVTVSDPRLGIIKFPSETIRTAMIREEKDDMFSMSDKGRAAGEKVAEQIMPKAMKRGGWKLVG